MAAHANAGVKSIVSLAGTNIPVPCCRLRKDPLDFGKIDTVRKQLSHDFAVPATLFVVDLIIKRGFVELQRFHDAVQVLLGPGWLAFLSSYWPHDVTFDGGPVQLPPEQSVE
ncbi:Uncharacterized protein HZ326_26016 [Fusarium oxysporum f. sp. albedinis]|nr:Uncharacterized protein HZ326_26016 [Fusarium oxysporum f. sp. albedinis]